MGRWKNKDILPPEVFPTPPYNAGVALKKNSLGQCLRDARRCHGLTLVDLSNLLMEYGVQISGAAISKWETGNSVPDAYQLLALCCVLDLENILKLLPSCRLPLLNAEGQKKVDAYRSDLIASGRYTPEASHPSNTICSETVQNTSNHQFLGS